MFVKPPAALLNPIIAPAVVDPRLLEIQANAIERHLAEFGVMGWVVGCHLGPAVTAFEFQLETGVALRSIINHSEDLSMALKATSVRIDRLPGKSTVGIEVPNTSREAIAFREVIESEAFANNTSPLALALGKGMDGAPFVNDLAQMPHLLIAGTTGSGKSVGLNAIITSLLMRCTPEECNLVLVDPKRVELGLYSDVPHLLTPVVTETKLAINALKWVVREMEERYKLLASCAVRNIVQFNKLVKDATAECEGAADATRLPKSLPYIVIAIDSHEILANGAAGDISEPLATLAREGAAAGLHLVIASQYPSAKELAGMRSESATRIAYRCASITDSNMILGGSGAEKLLGEGDMLIQMPGSEVPVRVQGVYVREDEIAKVVKYHKLQGKSRIGAAGKVSE